MSVRDWVFGAHYRFEAFIRTDWTRVLSVVMREQSAETHLDPA